MNSTTHLLIVEDEELHLKALCDTLKDKGYATTGFTSAQEALIELGRQRFDLLLTDLLMPEMDGIALLRAALAIDPQLVGIMMTGQGTISTAVEAMQVGALDYILKPIKLSAILPVLARALTVRRLREENARLAKRVSDYTADLETANKELEAFSYSVSHDLRAPLRAVTGFSQLLLSEDTTRLSDQQQQLLHKISANAELMADLVGGLLNLSRLGRQALSKQPINLTALVGQILDELGEEREGRLVEVRVAELPDCIGDPPLLRQVFTNLLSNAFKYTRKTERATIDVGCQQQNGENVYSVRDNGAGFDMHYAGKLFGAFQRLHNNDEFEGTGVGLSIVQRIIQRHGGRIWAEAEVAKGAAFFLTLGQEQPAKVSLAM